MREGGDSGGAGFALVVIASLVLLLVGFLFAVASSKEGTGGDCLTAENC
jgi:hypothetical protein